MPFYAGGLFKWVFAGRKSVEFDTSYVMLMSIFINEVCFFNRLFVWGIKIFLLIIRFKAIMM